MLLHEAWDWSLKRAVTAHLVEEMGMEVVDGLFASPDLVLVMLGSHDIEHVLGLTRAFAGTALMVAVTAHTDSRLAARAIRAGAAACYALDTPLAVLEATLREVLVPAIPARNEG